MDFKETSLWQAGFGGPFSQNQDAILLRDALLGMRELTKFLLNEISSDLRQYTVHDITHIDALWGVASEIAGDQYVLTPTEAFVLGGAFLLHDAGMSLAAYPEGMEQIEAHRTWPAILRRFAQDPESPAQNELDAAIIEFIRAEHANRARELPRLTWKAPDGTTRTLIENGDLRQKFGDFIGQIAASHWWSHDKLSSELDRVIPAPPPFPTAWSVDLLKLASILRVADAAQIDERRAPGFLWALKGRRLSTESARHWLFQNRLTQPECRADALHYSSTSDFERHEADAWWLAYDSLQMVDDELRRTDVLLADLRGESFRLAARRVAHCETPSTLVRSVGVSGWVPIDTSIRVADVPSLIRNLGGEALYGNDFRVPFRELVQNASDATKLRSAVQPDHRGWVKIVIGPGDTPEWIEVSDNGIGMTTDIIRNNLLDFGASGWDKDPVFEDYPEAKLSTSSLIGKFGIGFFSTFMLGDRVTLWTRRFEKAFDETLALNFEGGVGARPILSPAPRDEWLMEGGTRVRVWLRDPVKLVDYHGLNIIGPEKQTTKQVFSDLFPSLDVPIEIFWGETVATVDGSNWRTEPADKLVSRVAGDSELTDLERRFSSNVRPISNNDGTVVGRLAVCPDHVGRRGYRFMRPSGGGGAVVTKGAVVTRMDGLLGVIEGEPLRAARDLAVPVLERTDWSSWLSDQAALVRKMELDSSIEAEVSKVIAVLGGDVSYLKICLTSTGWLTVSELSEFISKRDTVTLFYEHVLHDEYHEQHNIDLYDGVILLPGKMFTVLDLDPGDSFREYELLEKMGYSIQNVIITIISNVWSIDKLLLWRYLNETEARGDEKYERKVPYAKSNGDILRDSGFIVSRTMSEEDLNRLSVVTPEERDTIDDNDW